MFYKPQKPCLNHVYECYLREVGGGGEKEGGGVFSPASTVLEPGPLLAILWLSGCLLPP